MLNVLDVLRSTVDDRWESLARVIDLHADADWGDVAREGSPLWHLWHTADCFRHHASKIIRDDLVDGNAWEAELARPDTTTPEALADTLRTDIERFATWFEAQAASRLAQPVQHGVEMSMQDMLNLMIRHVMWHITRAHGLLVDQVSG